jgi:hypothetical protein
MSSGLMRKSKIIPKSPGELKIDVLISNMKFVCKISIQILLYHRLKI